MSYFAKLSDILKTKIVSNDLNKSIAKAMSNYNTASV